MLHLDLPDLAETRSGKDLIEIGEKRGEKRGEKQGLTKAIALLLTSKHGSLPQPLSQTIVKLSVSKAEDLVAVLAVDDSLETVRKWLDENA